MRQVRPKRSCAACCVTWGGKHVFHSSTGLRNTAPYIWPVWQLRCKGAHVETPLVAACSWSLRVLLALYRIRYLPTCIAIVVFCVVGERFSPSLAKYIQRSLLQPPMYLAFEYAVSLPNVIPVGLPKGTVPFESSGRPQTFHETRTLYSLMGLTKQARINSATSMIDV